MLVLFGIIEIVVYIVAEIVSPTRPVMASIALNLKLGHSLDSNIVKEAQNLALDAFIFGIIKSFTVIVWFFVSNYFIKQRKVTTVIKLMKWYYLSMVLWMLLYAAQAYYSWAYLNKVIKKAI